MQKPGGGRKSRSAGRFRQAGNVLRPSDPNLFVEDQRRELPRSVELTRTAGQYDPAAGDLVEPAGLQTIAHELERLLDSWRDNSNEQGFGHVIDLAVVLLTDLRNGDHLALVGAR